VRLCAPDWYLCVQRQCPVCGIHKSEASFQRHPTCRECRSVFSTSTLNTIVSMDPTLFLQYINHEVTQGSRLSIFLRSSILTLHALELDGVRLAQLTGCDRRTMQQWVTHRQDYHCLQCEARSGRLRVMSDDSDGYGYQDTSCHASKDSC
jgi:hypothetical protein